MAKASKIDGLIIKELVFDGLSDRVVSFGVLFSGPRRAGFILAYAV